MRSPRSTVEDVFKRTRMDVLRGSNSKQAPWYSSTLEEEFIFSAPGMGRNYLAHAVNAVLAAASYNFRRLLAWLRLLLLRILIGLSLPAQLKAV
jgi:hypothetical protein